MGKIYQNLYEQVVSPLNLWFAYKDAARGKRYKPAAAHFEYDLEKNLIELEKELTGETYQPGEYHNFYIHKPKRRLISAAPFRDRVVHHALMNIIEPLFERQFIFDSYANRKGKGTHKALDRCTYFLRRYRYVMHLDVRQFFPSIDHEFLVGILSCSIGDKRVTNLVNKIIASGAGVQAGEYKMVYFPGDDIFSANRPRGLPIGNLTSQHWANVYLNQLDQHAKRVLKCRAYIRYVDDILLFANDKRTLHNWRAEIISFLITLRLKIHESKAQPRPTKTGIPFLGFQVFSTHRRIRPQNGYAFQRHLKRMILDVRNGNITQKEFSGRLVSWFNHAGYGDTWGLKYSILIKSGIYGGQDG
jgi:retron-type reverse transcriptase